MLSIVNGAILTPDMFLNVLGGTVLVGLILVGLYILVVYPIMAVAIGNMAYYNGEFKAAFRLEEILSIISKIGWVDLIIWYVVVIMVGIAISFIGMYIGNNSNIRMDSPHIICLSLHLSILYSSNSMVVFISI